MPVKSIKRIPVFAWIPPTFHALYKIEITRSDETIDDITTIIHGGELTDGVTDTIGNFSFTVDNSSEIYTRVWSGNETIKIYIDYATSATTNIFRGVIEKVSYQDNKIRITGRTNSSRLFDVTVTKAYDNTETSVILKELFDTYATEFTYTNVSTSSKNVTVSWYQKPFWEAVIELCQQAGFDCYIDKDLDCHYFESGTRDNTTEAVVHDSNLLSVGDFAYDQSLLKNRVVVYGADIGELPLFKTAEDITSQTQYGIKELIIKDEGIITEIQCQERADYELNLAKDPPLVGEVVCIGLATIQPGERIRVSSPMNNLPPQYYKIVSYRHEFKGYLETTLVIEKEPKKVYHIFKDRIAAEEKLSETPNPNEMRYSWNFDFDTDFGGHTNTEITDGVLKTDGSSSGTWISQTNSLSANSIHGELRVIGEKLSGTNYWISTDGGNTWQSTILNTAITFSPLGPSLRIKVELNSADTVIDGLALLYK